VKRRFVYGRYGYDYDLKLEDRETFSLTVKPSGKILLIVPGGVDDSAIQKFLEAKWVWLTKQLAAFDKYHKKRYVREYISGESHYYLGRLYKLTVKRGETNRAVLGSGKIELTTTYSVSDSRYNRLLLEQWYRARRRIIFEQCYEAVLGRFGYEERPSMAVKPMTKRWGSYTPSGQIVLNPKLILAEKAAIEYVIAHELCHVKYQNHGDEFHKLLESIIPEWKKVKEKLEVKHG
jgi:predicted metal-dependent hydrolase